MYDELVKNGFDEKKITVLPCYTDKISGSESSKMDGGPILCIGRFDGVKGIPQFIEALNHIKERPWNAEIAGEGIFRREAEEMIEKLGLDGSIKLLGRLSPDEIDQCYKHCSLVVVPSMIPESFGIVGIEAMSFGKPVVAFDSGGVREWLADGETGFLVKRGDVRGMAERIKQLLEDPELAERLGRAGYSRVKRNFQRDSHIDRLTGLYQEVISLRSSQ
jgi:glycosyltransferase involved in cell wall biosynthesis